MATSIRCRVMAISAFCQPTTRTPPPSITNCLVTIVHINPVNSNFSPKIGCHGNVSQHHWTPMKHMIPAAHPSPQPKRHLDRFSRFCIDDCTVSLYFTMGRPFSLKIAPFHGGIWTPSNTWFPGLTRVLNRNGISISAAIF